jgi:RNA-directed DNA polymerase
MKFLANLFSRGGANEGGRTVEELAARLGVDPARLRAIKPGYHEFTIPKRSGGTRKLSAPDPELKALQRLILHRLLRRLKAHPAAMGFERGRSIVTNACVHAGRPVIVKMDIKDFFTATSEKKVQAYFAAIGWNKEAAKLLAGLCCHRGCLPQGAPTSPRLSNLINRKLDTRLEALASKMGASYTRYADDLTFSFARDERKPIHELIGLTRVILEEHGYELHLHKKLQIRRQYEQQRVTGLVVNAGVALPRKVRRWLRAVEHRASKGGQPTLTSEQLQGWRALRSMIAQQGGRKS